MVVLRSPLAARGSQLPAPGFGLAACGLQLVAFFSRITHHASRPPHHASRFTSATVLALALLVSCAAPRTTATPLAVPIGATDLLADGTFRIGYQYFGKAPVWLGRGWTGHHHPSGIYWLPSDSRGSRGEVFMHCPWRGGTGVAFADVEVVLPRTTRLRLDFEASIRPTAKKTDGVTYRVKANGRTLFERHCTNKTFRPFEADLADLAGTTVVLRLEVDPGPDRNTADDWSLWRNIRILAGTPAEVAAAEKRAAKDAARRRAAEIARAAKLADTSLLPLTSAATTSVCPSTLRPVGVSVRAKGGAYVFRCRGADETIEYRLDPSEGLWGGLSARVDGKGLEPSAFRCEPRLWLDGREWVASQVETTLAEARLDGLKLHCRYEFKEPKSGVTAWLKLALWPQGKSLGLEVWGEADRFSAFTVQPHSGRTVPTAFAFGGAPVWRRERVYVATVGDLMASEASGVHRWGVTYRQLTDGTRNAMHDRFFLTVSSRYEETLSNLAHKPSPYLAELAHRVVLDAWGGSFAENEQWLRDMAVYGIDSFLMIKHVWQRDGYDRTYPNTIPANASMGGDAGLRSLSLAAQKLGHRFNVHENYYDYYPNAEDFREADCALDPKGAKQPGWDRGPVAAVILKPSKLMHYARKFSPEIKRRYDCDSAYHDIMPTWRVDFDAKVKDAGKIRVTHEITRELCDYDRKLYGGPVVFEAADWHTAGIYDGGCNHGVDTYRTPIAVAFELLKVHPRMSNHGFGYYERWLADGYKTPGWHSYVMTDRELDRFRATTIAFGRTGFVGQQLMRHPHGVAREYHLMQAFGRAYTARRAVRIRYQIDGQWADAGTAARHNELERLHVEYEGGQNVYVNFADAPWQVAGHTLPSGGSLTLGQRAEAWTALREGQTADFARYGKVLYADARSHQWLPPQAQPPIEPVAAAFKHLGGADFELTVHWKVGRTVEDDYRVFWHFRDSGIDFQRDHTPARPTSTWKVGDTVVDGPLRLSVKDDPVVMAYDIVVGLYGKDKRVALVRGIDAVRIGRLRVEREGDKATKVSLEPTSMKDVRGFDRAPYLEGANTAKKILDFGTLATNGAVVVRTTDAGREVVPVPIGEVFTIGLGGKVSAVKAFDAAGKPLAAPRLTRRDGKAWFDTHKDAAKYLVAN